MNEFNNRTKTKRKSLCYSLEDTVLINIQTDSQFLQDVRTIADNIKIASNKQLKQNKQQLTQEQLQQIAEKANKHAEANTFNKTTMLDFKKIQDEVSCNCGCNRGTGQLFPIMLNQQNLTFLGPGVIMFFFYLRYILLLVLISWVIFTSLNLNTNRAIWRLNDVIPCNFQFFYTQQICNFNEVSTIQNKLMFPILLTIQLWSGFLFCIVWMIGIKTIHILGIEKDKLIDQYLDSASDYTVRIQGLPSGQYTEQQVISYIQQLWNSKTDNEAMGNSLKLISIQIAYNTSQVRQLIEKITKQCEQLTCMFKKTSYNFSNTIIENQVNIYKQKKRSIINKFRQLQRIKYNFKHQTQFRKKFSTSCAFIQFAGTMQHAQFVKQFTTEIYNPLQKFFCADQNGTFKGSKLIISRAPQPSDINWLNCQKQFSYFAYFSIWGMTILILVIGYTLIFFAQTSTFITSSNTTIVATILQLFNRIIWNALNFLVIKYEQNNTKTQTIVSIMKRCIIAQAINVILTPVVAKYINHRSLYGNSGLSGIVMDFQIVLFVLMLFYYILNPQHLFKKIRLSIKYTRNRLIRSLLLSDDAKDIQSYEDIKKVLEYYEGPPFPIAGGYVFITTVIYHAAFYCHIQPAVLLLALINVSVFFLIMKYMIFRRCKIPELTSRQIFQVAIFAMLCAPVFYGAGSLFFLFVGNQNESTNFLVTYDKVLPSALCLLFWFIGTLNPFQFLDKIVQQLLNYAYPKRSQSLPKKTNRAKSFGQSIFFDSSFFAKNVWKRRQSYYSGCLTGLILDYQSALKDKKDKKNIKPQITRSFCEYFFKNRNVFYDINETSQQTPNTLIEKKVDFIPVELISSLQQ